jgi:hypothetical protein
MWTSINGFIYLVMALIVLCLHWKDFSTMRKDQIPYTLGDAIVLLFTVAIAPIVILWLLVSAIASCADHVVLFNRASEFSSKAGKLSDIIK